jgi:hypothetical protein
MGMTQKIADASKAGLHTLEERLAGILRPIPARREFVRGLSRRIQSPPPGAMIDRPADVRFLALVLAGLFSLGVLIAILVRYLPRPGRIHQRQA